MGEKLLKPAEFAEKKLVEAILGSVYPPGKALPSERILAGELGVTRPTLRETLQRLSREGWVTICHGKSTQVNDYLNTGGLSILSSLAKYGKKISRDLVSHLLEARTTMFPGIAQKAVENAPEEILAYLKTSENLKDRSQAFAGYDWGLQMLMVSATHNPVFNMMLNDFEPLYAILGKIYFQKKEARAASMAYYRDLSCAMEQDRDKVKALVEKTMIQSEKIWQALG